jgi:hypothetical protein
VGGLALAVVVVIAGGGVVLASGWYGAGGLWSAPGGGAGAGSPGDTGGPGTGGGASQSPEHGLDTLAPGQAPEQAQEPAPEQVPGGSTTGAPAPAAQGAAGDATEKVTPTPPRLMAVSRTGVTPAVLGKIEKLAHVRKVAAVDAGAVRISGTGLNLLAVDPVEFRSWTPEIVAGQPAVWSALARGELVAETSARRRLGLVLGAEYQVDGGPRLRVAAAAPLGLPGIDGLVSADVGRGLGLPAGVAVLVHEPTGKAQALPDRVRRLLGTGAQVVAIGTTGERGRTERGRTESAAQEVNVGRPGSYLELYRVSARVCPGLSWTVLAAIGQVESSHGRNNGPSSAGALGPMQFMPATWKAYGVDGDGDGVADIWNPYDAVPSAANYLCANGAGQGGKKLEKAIWFYNHSWSYVAKVMSLAEGYARSYP